MSRISHQLTLDEHAKVLTAAAEAALKTHHDARSKLFTVATSSEVAVDLRTRSDHRLGRFRGAVARDRAAEERRASGSVGPPVTVDSSAYRRRVRELVQIDLSSELGRSTTRHPGTPWIPTVTAHLEFLIAATHDAERDLVTSGAPPASTVQIETTVTDLERALDATSGRRRLVLSDEDATARKTWLDGLVEQHPGLSYGGGLGVGSSPELWSDPQHVELLVHTDWSHAGVGKVKETAGENGAPAWTVPAELSATLGYRINGPVELRFVRLR